MSFEIVTDSTSNLSLEQMQKYNIKVISLSYFIDGIEHCGHEKWLKEDCSIFFKLVKEKHDMTTSLPPYSEYSTVFNTLAEAKKDILYIGCSSGLSGTFHTVNLFLEDLKDEYPELTILSIDSLSASCGEGLLVDYAVKLRNEKKNIEETFSRLQIYKYKICHEFVVDDLFYIKRSGRISVKTALAGVLLQIKPILHVNNLGLPEIINKARGRKAALNLLIENIGEKMDKDECQTVYICHANCLIDAEYLATTIKERYNIKNVEIRYSEPIIGLHTGSGAIGLFFVGKQR